MTDKNIYGNDQVQKDAAPISTICTAPGCMQPGELQLGQGTFACKYHACCESTHAWSEMSRLMNHPRAMAVRQWVQVIYRMNRDRAFCKECERKGFDMELCRQYLQMRCLEAHFPKEQCEPRQYVSPVTGDAFDETPVQYALRMDAMLVSRLANAANRDPNEEFKAAADPQEYIEKSLASLAAGMSF